MEGSNKGTAGRQVPPLVSADDCCNLYACSDSAFLGKKRRQEKSSIFFAAVHFPENRDVHGVCPEQVLYRKVCVRSD